MLQWYDQSTRSSDRCWFVALVHSKLRPLLVADSLLLCDVNTLRLAQLMFEVNCFNCGLLALCAGRHVGRQRSRHPGDTVAGIGLGVM